MGTTRALSLRLAVSLASVRRDVKYSVCFCLSPSVLKKKSGVKGGIQRDVNFCGDQQFPTSGSGRVEKHLLRSVRFERAQQLPCNTLPGHQTDKCRGEPPHNAAVLSASSVVRTRRSVLTVVVKVLGY